MGISVLGSTPVSPELILPPEPLRPAQTSFSEPAVKGKVRGYRVRYFRGRVSSYFDQSEAI